jgi:hypothetical protein
MTDLHPLPVQPLEYQLPAEAAASPWATVVRAVGWTAAALAAAHLASALASTAFWLGRRGQLSGSFLWFGGVVTSLFYVPVLIGGLACARLRPHGWKVLTYGLLVVLGTRAILLLLAPVSLLIDRSPSNWGALTAVGRMGQSVFSILADAVPLVFMVWVMRRPGVRQQFDVPRQIPWAPEVN